MNKQQAWTLCAATVGFVAALCFCSGSTTTTPENIIDQATPRWDFSDPVAISIITQKSQYMAGGLLLLVSFIFQIFAIQQSTSPATLPRHIKSASALVLVVFLSSLVFAYCSYKTALSYNTTAIAISKTTINKQNP